MDQNCRAGSWDNAWKKLKVLPFHWFLITLTSGYATKASHSLHRDAEDMGGVAEGGEHHDGGQEWGEEVHHRHDVGVHMHPGVKLVVAAKHDDAAEVLTM